MQTPALMTTFSVNKYTSSRVVEDASIRQDSVLKIVLACFSIQTPLTVDVQHNSGGYGSLFSFNNESSKFRKIGVFLYAHWLKN